MNLLNESGSLSSDVNSRYTIVLAVAKRARQITEGSKPVVEYVDTDKAVSIAVREMEQGKLIVEKVLTD